MRFIDLFAGLGGFHLALRRLGHECVFACEINDTLQTTYERNFDIKPLGDIRDVVAKSVHDHEILCAGFPCQPFSKAGQQLGFECPSWGDLFGHVVRILRVKRPQFFMLENVPHLERHKDGGTWAQMKKQLEDLKYKVEEKRLSPHHFGIPQVRERLFIVGKLRNLEGFSWPEKESEANPDITKLLDKEPPNARRIPEQVEDCLKVWQKFLDAFPKGEELPSWPIWAMEFGATYPYEGWTLYDYSPSEMREFKGAFGVPLRNLTRSQRLNALPSYARKPGPYPAWKVNFIRHNRELYIKHKKWIDRWLPKIRRFPACLQKLEWNCKGEERQIWDYLIQFRASGVRVKRPTSAPSLIAMTTTQVPIVGWEKRYLTPHECAKLQGLGDLEHLPEIPNRAYAALGNAVNADLVEKIAERLVGRVTALELLEAG
ncbi:MAG: DNA (cytosine-5-)-methyltransferase [Candidatus Hydrogenedentes bacterium]|jgi:DNA (cytosine-5)-methyltransferase 1|nr:DNA (cytosine-5-)-methyltransferase [Candidatus Hydrogenedentota bacterium]